MKPSEALDAHREDIRRIVRAHKGHTPRVFGSVLSGEDSDQSDLDLLVEHDGTMSLFDLGGMIDELSECLGVEVDVLTPKFLPPKIRDSVLEEARPV